MEFRGVLPIDEPDPSIQSEARLRSLTFPVMQLQPQRAITRAPITGFMESMGSAGREQLSASFSYTLWRFPEDRSDPRNEVELDEHTRRSIEDEPPWGRPPWLIEQAGMHKYPTLWEAIRTTWHARPETERASVSQQLVDHANHILRNQFREQLGLPPGPGGGDAWKVTSAGVAPSSVVVDGHERSALHIDTDPFVYGVAFRVEEHVVCTAVVARDSLPFLDFALTTFK